MTVTTDRHMETNAFNQEVEIRAILSPQQKEEIYNHLKEEATYQGSKAIKDIYFCKKEILSFSEIAMKEIGSYSLRLRAATKGDSTTFSLNSKVITQYNDHNSWKEYETRAILKTIGFKEFFTLEKRRDTFTKLDVAFHLEEIQGFQPALEIEILSTKEQSDITKQRIFTLLEKMGIYAEQIVPKSITYLLMEEKAKF